MLKLTVFFLLFTSVQAIAACRTTTGERICQANGRSCQEAKDNASRQFEERWGYDVDCGPSRGANTWEPCTQLRSGFSARAICHRANPNFGGGRRRGGRCVNIGGVLSC